MSEANNRVHHNDMSDEVKNAIVHLTFAGERGLTPNGLAAHCGGSSAAWLHVLDTLVRQGMARCHKDYVLGFVYYRAT